jgi:hypothetical protein
VCRKIMELFGKCASLFPRASFISSTSCYCMCSSGC